MVDIEEEVLEVMAVITVESEVAVESDVVVLLEVAVLLEIAVESDVVVGEDKYVSSSHQKPLFPSNYTNTHIHQNRNPHHSGQTVDNDNEIIIMVFFTVPTMDPFFKSNKHSDDISDHFISSCRID